MSNIDDNVEVIHSQRESMNTDQLIDALVKARYWAGGNAEVRMLDLRAVRTVLVHGAQVIITDVGPEQTGPDEER
jgi:hypothetical protein